MSQLVPLIILIPALGSFTNMVAGSRLTEKQAGLIGIFASTGAFIIALLLYFGLLATNYQEAVVNPFFFDSWIRIPAEGLEIPWQLRVDTLSVTMMLVVTGVGSLIHVYAMGYMHGDPMFARFFAYLNMFLVFMLILVTANNLLMLFVGWEGVGLCSYLLIGFWFNKPGNEGWQNSNAARKAFIANRVGDFGLLMAIFLTFWTFGTLDFYKPAEVVNPDVQTGAAYSEGGHGEDAGHGAEEEAHGEEAAGEEHSSVIVLTSNLAVEEPGGEEHPTDPAIAAAPAYPDNSHLELEQMGIFGQAERLMKADEPVMVDLGPFEFRFGVVLTIITLFMLLGATGKSAQIPLFVWLPDAMAGPTPVSALIHAATMVTAGVYMMVRANTFFYYADVTSFIVALIGMTTALMAGFIALGQWDIKRVLAYSTVSQLGFMVASVGVGAYVPAMFHLVTHAFFKALLFLGSGSVIHGVEHGHHHAHEHGHDDDAHHDEEHEDAFDPQDMRNMGGLWRKMPITFWTYIIGTLSLAGIWPLAGFWSKDEILADSLMAGIDPARGSAWFSVGGYFALLVLLAAAGFTAFYMWRQIELVFFGEPRTEAAKHAPESDWWMTIPLIVLAFFVVFLGAMNQPGTHRFATWLEYSARHAHASQFNLLLALVALSVGIGAIVLAHRVYGDEKGYVENEDALARDPRFRQAWQLSNAKLLWDEAYFAVFITPYMRVGDFLANQLDWKWLHDDFHDALTRGFQRAGKALAQPVDQGIIDGAVLGLGRLAQWAGNRLKQPQNGFVRNYGVWLLSGALLVIIFLLIPLFSG